MLKLVITASALALSAPVMAQEMGTDTQTDSTTTTPPAGDPSMETQTVPADPVTPVDDGLTDQLDRDAMDDSAPSDSTDSTELPAEPMRDPGDGLDEAAEPTEPMDEAEEPMAAPNDPMASATNSSSDVEAFVEQQFPAYDGDASGELNAQEFAAWMAPLHKADNPDADAATTDVWAGQAFALADADQNASVSKDELKQLLMG